MCSCIVSVWFIFCGIVFVCVFTAPLLYTFLLSGQQLLSSPSPMVLGRDWPLTDLFGRFGVVRVSPACWQTDCPVTNLIKQGLTVTQCSQRSPSAQAADGSKHHCHNQIHYPPSVTEQTASIRYRPAGSPLMLLLSRAHAHTHIKGPAGEILWMHYASCAWTAHPNHCVGVHTV